jgi:hypothetical protein
LPTLVRRFGKAHRPAVWQFGAGAKMVAFRVEASKSMAMNRKMPVLTQVVYEVMLRMEVDGQRMTGRIRVKGMKKNLTFYVSVATL